MSEKKITRPLVLSIQSHTVHGRCGNRSAVLPLEVNGIDVDPLNTCHLSAHSAFPNHNGTIINKQQLKVLFEDLRLNGVTTQLTHVLSGYINAPEIMSEIASFVRSLGPSINYLCDPVLGDCGKYYVRHECLLEMKKNLIPLARTITPNHFEAMWLSECSMNNQQELLVAVKKLHQLGPRNVVITSTEWNHRYIFFSWDFGNEQFAIETPSLEKRFHGPGDLFAALLFANLINYPDQHMTIATRTVNSVYAVLKKTIELGLDIIALPQCIDEMMNPPEIFRPIAIEQFMTIDVRSNVADKVY